jgi:hypothetical protein
MRHATANKHAIDDKSRSDGVDHRIAALADRQHGRVARWQLLEMGLGRGAINHRLEKGRLHSVGHGVFAVGHRVQTAEAIWITAVLGAGPGAVLSHRSAAALWALRPSARAATEVTVERKLKSRRAIQVHRARLPEDEITLLDDIRAGTGPG